MKPFAFKKNSQERLYRPIERLGRSLFTVVSESSKTVKTKINYNHI